MPTIKKPDFPTLNTADLGKKLDDLGSAVEQAKQADGSVDLGQVEQAVGDDAVLRASLAEIKDSFQRTETRTSSGCGAPTTRQVEVDPSALDAAEVQSVMGALLAAKSRVDAVDQNSDGVLQRGEAEGADPGAGLAGKIAKTVVDGALDPFQQELVAWRTAVTKALDSVGERGRLDRGIVRRAAEHAETSAGASAIVWAYREIVASGRGVDTAHMGATLDNAETSFLRHIPLFGDNLTQNQGHLSDDEVKSFLGTTDLRGFVREKRESIRQLVGGDYLSHFLGGHDMPELEQAADAEFARVTTGC